MFGFLKRKPKNIPLEWQGFADRFLGPMAMATAMADIAGAHAARIEAGEVAYPAHKEAGAPVIRIWHYLRLESCIPAIRFGEGSLADLADIGTQRDVLAAFVENRAHLMFPQPSGSRFDQSVQGMFQVYEHLSDVGTDVCDPLTDRHTLRYQKRDILTDLEAGAAALHKEWSEPLGTDGRAVQLPRTLFDLFFADLNAKTKSIAFATVFGPYIEKEIAAIIAEARESDGDAAADHLEKVIMTIWNADNPDQAAELTDALR